MGIKSEKNGRPTLVAMSEARPVVERKTMLLDYSYRARAAYIRRRGSEDSLATGRIDQVSIFSEPSIEIRIH